MTSYPRIVSVLELVITSSPIEPNQLLESSPKKMRGDLPTSSNGPVPHPNRKTHNTFRVSSMFNLFKSSPDKKIRKQYLAKLEKAMYAQRNGKIREYSLLTAEAEALREKLELLQADTQA